MPTPINLLVNLPPGFFKAPIPRPVFARLSKIGRVRKRSHNTPQEIEADLAWADAVLMWSWPMLSDELLDQAPRLRFSGQLDISQAAARIALARGLAVSVGRRAWTPAVAEMALGLILSTLRRISSYHGLMRRGAERWIKVFPTDIDPLERELTGRSVGLVGFGAIGRRLAELLAPFRCDLRICDPYLAEGVEKPYGGRRVELAELVRRSDVVVLCAASNEGTRHLIGRRQIAAMPKGAVLVNVARAALVDTQALIARLRKGDLDAAIDVFDQEPLPRNAPLRRLPNAFLTPHRAGGILASVERIVGMLADDLENHVAGRPLRWPLTETMLPSLDR